MTCQQNKISRALCATTNRLKRPTCQLRELLLVDNVITKQFRATVWFIFPWFDHVPSAKNYLRVVTIVWPNRRDMIWSAVQHITLLPSIAVHCIMFTKVLRRFNIGIVPPVASATSHSLTIPVLSFIHIDPFHFQATCSCHGTRVVAWLVVVRWSPIVCGRVNHLGMQPAI